MIAAGKVVLREDETLLGFVSRIAADNALSLSDFCSLKGTSTRSLAWTLPKAVDLVARQWKLDPVELAERGLRREGAWTKYVSDMNRYRSIDWKRPRYCPVCVAEDIDTGTGLPAARPFQRASWLSPFVNVCVVHQTPLVGVAEELAELHAGDFAGLLSLSRRKVATEALKAARVEVHPSQAYFTRRMNAPRSHGEFLDMMYTHSAATACAAFGRLLGVGTSDDAFEKVAIGYAAISGGPVAIRASIQARIDGLEGRGLGRKTVVYGPLLELLGDDSGGLYDCVRDVIRDDGLARLPLAEGDDFFGPVDKRRVHSVWSASEEFGVDPRHVRYIFKSNGLVGQRDDKRRDSDTLVEAGAAKALLGKVEGMEVVSQRQLLEVLGTTADVMDMLWTRGFFTDVGRSRRAEFPVAQLGAFQAHWTKLVSRKIDRRNLIPLREASRRSGLPTRHLVAMILDGRLSAHDPGPGPAGIKSTLVPAGAVHSVIANERNAVKAVEFHSARATTQVLGVSDQALKQLLKSGLLAHERMGTYRNAMVAIPKTIVEDFARLHISAWQVQLATGWAMKSIRERLRGHGIVPAIDLIGHKTTTFYPRASVEELLARGTLPRDLL